jgi:hypothetical protein
MKSEQDTAFIEPCSWSSNVHRRQNLKSCKLAPLAQQTQLDFVTQAVTSFTMIQYAASIQYYLSAHASLMLCTSGQVITKLFLMSSDIIDASRAFVR